MSSRRTRQEPIPCPVCHSTIEVDLGSHIRQVHGENAFREAVLHAKEDGLPDIEIGERYGVSFNTLQQIITESYGANISVLRRPKRIKRWEPQHFQEERTTVWSFRRRGDWATHDGRYRGNWAPYIPRNVILKYTRPGEIVLDYFVGGGTTAVEAKLLGRRCIARDINPEAVSLTRTNLEFSPPPTLFDPVPRPLYEPEVSVGDARELSGIGNNSIDLICAHPPYAGIIKYSANATGDLSGLEVQGFLVEMRKVAQESLRVLRPGGRCAILIGDARKSRNVVPVGFQTIRVFLDAGFAIGDLVIKRQHNCKTTGFWYTRSIQYNFLLLAHEYLPIFEKPISDRVSDQQIAWSSAAPYHSTYERVGAVEKDEMETTTVWVFPKDRMNALIERNLLRRFALPDSSFVVVSFAGDSPSQVQAQSNPSLVYLAPPVNVTEAAKAAGYRAAVAQVADHAGKELSSCTFLVIDTQDIRIGQSLWPMGMLLWEDMANRDDFVLKEIVVVVPEETPTVEAGEHLHITHRYLLVYSKK